MGIFTSSNINDPFECEYKFSIILATELAGTGPFVGQTITVIDSALFRPAGWRGMSSGCALRAATRVQITFKSRRGKCRSRAMALFRGSRSPTFTHLTRTIYL